MNKEILIVEDSPTQLEQLKFILEQNGYTVEPAINGKHALEVLKNFNPALIISDILMPEMDGYTLCDNLKADSKFKDIPVMLLTSLSDPQDVIKGLQCNADNFLTKPYSEEFLLSRINYILLNQELRKKTSSSDVGMEIVFGGEKYFINSNRMQIVDLLLSTYENAILKNTELAEANKQLLLMHKEMEVKNAQLEKLNEDKSKFLRMAAHDLRNPISAILTSSSFLTDLLEEKVDESELEFLNLITRSGEFVLQLLNELLDLEVIESGHLELNREMSDFIEIVKNNVILNKVIADKKNIKLTFENDIESLQANVDKVKIEQVLNNLISNAIKFSHAGSDIKVNLTTKNSDVQISVVDKGQGIPEKEMDKLFKPFGKTSVRGTGGEESTGLGLSIAKKIVEAHTGKIWVESEVNKGSTFYFQIPIS